MKNHETLVIYIYSILKRKFIRLQPHFEYKQLEEHAIRVEGPQKYSNHQNNNTPLLLGYCISIWSSKNCLSRNTFGYIRCDKMKPAYEHRRIDLFYYRTHTQPL